MSIGTRDVRSDNTAGLMRFIKIVKESFIFGIVHVSSKIGSTVPISGIWSGQHVVFMQLLYLI